jgi:hypothetical protein
MNLYNASLLALLAIGAQGDTAAVAQNDNGSLFHLTDEKTADGYRAFVVSAHNIRNILEGSWTWDNEGVFIKWQTGDVVRYRWAFWKANLAILKKIGADQKANDADH